MQERNCNGLEQRATYFCWMRFSLLASADVTQFQRTEAYSSFEGSNVKYNKYIHSRDDLHHHYYADHQ
jgi:hypothetical protein